MATTSRQRVPAAQRRDELIDAAMDEFATGGLHATPVASIARHVGVAQPYVFSLFPTKKDLFIAAVERCFERVGDEFMEAEPTLQAVGERYIEMLAKDRRPLTLQLHSYAAACDDEEIAVHVRAAYARLLQRVQERTGAEPDQMQVFSANGMWLTVQAAMGVEDLTGAAAWMDRTRVDFKLPYGG